MALVDVMDERKIRLHALLDLARVSRGWSRAQLARAIGRDPTKVYPDSGNPKADFLVKLAGILEWPVGDLLEAIWGDELELSSGASASQGSDTPTEYRAKYDEARAAHADGAFKRVVDAARAMHALADTDERRAFACAMEYSGWDGLGRYQQGVDACRRGLRYAGVSSTTRNILHADLANAWYSLGDLAPALGTAEMLVTWYDQNPPARSVDRKRVAFVRYLRGNIRRCLTTIEPQCKDTHGAAGLADLRAAAALYRELAVELEDPSLAGIANTCDGGVVEIETELGLREPAEAVAHLLQGVESAREASELIIGDWLESYGWWCIFGGNLAVRHLTGRAQQDAVRRFTAKALAIADRLDNWAMRERVFSTQFLAHRHLADQTGLDLEFQVDERHRSHITAAMGRFPAFRPLAWQMLQSARLVDTPAGGAA
jgi:hypothetical protein